MKAITNQINYIFKYKIYRKYTDGLLYL